MAISSESSFFGLDLNQLKADVLKTLRKAPKWPPLSWLRPEQALMLVPAEGEPRVVWESGAVAQGIKRPPEFWSVELPESMVLRKTLQLPSLDPQDCASAAQLEAQAISPFTVTELLWGYTELSRSAKAVRLQLVLASRVQVMPFLQAKETERSPMQTGADMDSPEVWVFSSDRRPIVIQGFGELQRAQAGRKKLLRNLAALMAASVLLAAIAVTPTMQLRLRAIEAVKAFDVMVAQAGNVVRKREHLMQSADQVAALSGLLTERIDMVKVLSMLTTSLGDDTALQTVRLQGDKLSLNGVTDNSSALMQKLSSQSGISDVKAPTAATRILGSDKESFSIELVLDAKVFAPSLKVEPKVEKTPAFEEPAVVEVKPSESPVSPKRKGATLGGGAAVSETVSEPAVSVNPGRGAK